MSENDLIGTILLLAAGAGVCLFLSWNSLPDRLRKPLAFLLGSVGAVAIALVSKRGPPQPPPKVKRKSEVVRDEAGRVRMTAAVEAEKKKAEIENADRDNLIKLWNAGRKNDGNNREE